MVAARLFTESPRRVLLGNRVRQGQRFMARFQKVSQFLRYHNPTNTPTIVVVATMAPVLTYTTSATKKITQLIPIASRTVPAIKRPLPTFSLVALSLRRHKMRCWMVGAIKKAVANAVDSSAAK